MTDDQTAAGGDVWVSSAGLARLAIVHRLKPVLVRMGGCRFTAAAQDAGRIIAALEASGDYCRDVSYPAPAVDLAAPPDHVDIVLPGGRVVAFPCEPDTRPIVRPVRFDERHVGGAFDGTNVTSDADSGL